MADIAVHIRLKGYLSRTGVESGLILKVAAQTSVKKVIEMLARRDERLAGILLDSKGLPDRGVAIFFDRTLVPYAQLGHKKITSACEITIVPTVAGG